MNIYALGTKNKNPDEWSIWEEVSIVVANNEVEAFSLIEMPVSDNFCIIDLDFPKVLHIGQEPDWGDDL